VTAKLGAVTLGTAVGVGVVLLLSAAPVTPMLLAASAGAGIVLGAGLIHYDRTRP
jgi:hypothetical protein